MNRISVWWIGDVHRPEWQNVRWRLELHLSNFDQTVLSDLGAVEQRRLQFPSPDLILICQSWPDEFPASHVGRLLSAVPLARVVCLTGAWCEATGRSRKHWPQGLAAPWWQAVSRVEFEIDVLCGRRPALPWTVTRDEFVEHRQWEPLPPQVSPTSSRLRARVEFFDPALRAELKQQLTAFGWCCIDDEDAKVSIVFVQAEPTSSAQMAALAERCRAVNPARVVAVTSWPLPQYCEQLRAAGVYAVINPLEPNDLVDALRASDDQSIL